MKRCIHTCTCNSSHGAEGTLRSRAIKACLKLQVYDSPLPTWKRYRRSTVPCPICGLGITVYDAPRGTTSGPLGGFCPQLFRLPSRWGLGPGRVWYLPEPQSRLRHDSGHFSRLDAGLVLALQAPETRKRYCRA